MPSRNNAPRNPMRPTPPEKNEFPQHPPGSPGWVLEKMLTLPSLRTDPNSYWNSLSGEEQEKLTKVLQDMKSPSQELQRNRASVKHIRNWVTGNNWMMIEGGEHDGKWVNPRYPTTTFQTGRMNDMNNHSHVYFPIANSLTDPEGIACHYEMNAGGISYSIMPNKWISASTLRYHRRKQQHRRRRQRKKYMREQGLEELEDTAAHPSNFIVKTMKRLNARV